MRFLHYEVKAGPGQIIRVTISTEADVRLLDGLNFAKYRLGKSFEETAGPETHGPVRFMPPFQGVWHVVVDMGGRQGVVRASVDVIDR